MDKANRNICRLIGTHGIRDRLKRGGELSLDLLNMGLRHVGTKGDVILERFEFGFNLSVLRYGKKLPHTQSELRRLNRLCGDGGNLLVCPAGIGAKTHLHKDKHNEKSNVCDNRDRAAAPPIRHKRKVRIGKTI